MILAVVGIVLFTVGIVYVVDKFLPHKAKPIVSIVFGLLSIFLAYLLYQSITGPIRFQEIKEKRFAKVINNLKDIRRSQEAYKSVTGRYAKDFKGLVDFVERANYTITQQRDTSFMVYDKAFQIDVQKDSVLIDTLGIVSVRDSLFKKDDRFKTMMNVPGALNGEKFAMKSDIIDKGGYKVPVYEVKIEKKVVLGDQPEDLLSRENAQIGVDEINGNVISVGSLTQVSTAGNWPPAYDRKSAQ
jgi:hypothetical protein